MGQAQPDTISALLDPCCQSAVIDQCFTQTREAANVGKDPGSCQNATKAYPLCVKARSGLALVANAAGGAFLMLVISSVGV